MEGDHDDDAYLSRTVAEPDAVLRNKFVMYGVGIMYELSNFLKPKCTQLISLTIHLIMQFKKYCYRRTIRSKENSFFHSEF